MNALTTTSEKSIIASVLLGSNQTSGSKDLFAIMMNPIMNTNITNRNPNPDLNCFVIL